MATDSNESPKQNLQLKGGMNPAYRCAYCDYANVTFAEGPCFNCERGLPPPNLDFLREMCRNNLRIRDVSHL